MRSGEPDARKGFAIAWTLLIAMLPFLIILVMDNLELMKVFIHIANVTYYGVFVVWGWVASLLGSFMVRLSEKKGWVKLK